MAYYTTSYIFNTSTTSTAALMVWQALSHSLEFKHLPMTGEELAAVSGITEEAVDRLFQQNYYQKYYGFRRFETLEEFQAWAMETGVFYNPALHDAKPEEEPEDEELDEEEDEAE